jgi:hypothetical protein
VEGRAAWRRSRARGSRRPARSRSDSRGRARVAVVADIDDQSGRAAVRAIEAGARRSMRAVNVRRGPRNGGLSTFPAISAYNVRRPSRNGERTTLPAISAYNVRRRPRNDGLSTLPATQRPARGKNSSATDVDARVRGARTRSAPLLAARRSAALCDAPPRCPPFCGIPRRLAGRRSAALRAQATTTTSRPTGGSRKQRTGGDLLSQALASQVPSALWGLTALFGMGRGVSPTQ